jgi:hypothetical protein
MNRLRGLMPASITTILLICAAVAPATAAAVTAPPTITIATPTEGQHFALNAAIAAVYDCIPGGSTVTSCAAPGSVSTYPDGAHTFTVNATDAEGHSVSKTVNYVVDPDTTLPTITITTPADGRHYALGATIVVDFTCDDAGGSGVDTCTAAGPIDYGVGTHAYTVNATDHAGNPASETVHYTVDPDITPPTVSITSPGDGQHYASGTTFPGTFTCDDAGGSGVATCAAATGIDLSVGTHVFTVTATDGAGNPASRSVTYVVDAPRAAGGETPGGGGTPVGGTPSGATPAGSTPTGTTPTGDTPAAPTLASTPRVTVPARASIAALTRGVSLSLSGLEPRSRVELRIRRGLQTIKTLRATANAAGKVTFKITLSRTRLRTLRGKTLTLRFTTTAANGKRKVVTKKLRVF